MFPSFSGPCVAAGAQAQSPPPPRRPASYVTPAPDWPFLGEHAIGLADHVALAVLKQADCAVKAPKEPVSDAYSGWLLLLHHSPKKTAYARVKLWRQLRAMGAAVLRNSAYVLPRTERNLDEMRRLVRQIERHGGEAALCETRFVDGISEAALKSLFNDALEKEYVALEAQLRKFAVPGSGPRSRQGDSRVRLEKLGQKLADLSARDFFGAKGRGRVLALLARLEHQPIARPAVAKAKPVPAPALTGKTWVTRKDIHVDRIACAWLIRRFIDPKAGFKFVGEKTYRPTPGELCFDMKGAEFTHEGDMCSFEVLLSRLGLADPALKRVAEVIHELDIRDGKFERPEAVGIGHIIDGICMTQHDDMARIARGGALLDDVYERFSQC